MCVCVCAHACAQLCPTHYDPKDCSPPGSSVHGIFRARILEWVAISFSRGSSLPRDPTHVFYISCIGRQVFFTTGTTWEAALVWPTVCHHLGLCSNITSSEALSEVTGRWHPTWSPFSTTITLLCSPQCLPLSPITPLIYLWMCEHPSAPQPPTFDAFCTSTLDTMPSPGRFSVNECSAYEWKCSSLTQISDPTCSISTFLH